MRRLTQAPNLAIAALWVDALRAEGVAAAVLRQFLSGAAGELPPDQCLPEIWISDDSQLARARVILRTLEHPPQHRWRCVCGEVVEGGFETCWHCGEAMPDPVGRG